MPAAKTNLRSCNFKSENVVIWSLIVFLMLMDKKMEVSFSAASSDDVGFMVDLFASLCCSVKLISGDIKRRR